MAPKTGYKVVRSLGETQLPPPLVVAPKMPLLSVTELRQKIRELMAERKYDPVQELIEMAQAKRKDSAGVETYVYDATFRRDIHMELMQYVTPKLKSTDLQVHGDMNVNISVIKFADTGQTRPGNREALAVKPIDV